MKLPKKKKRFCPYCKRHTEHKVDIVSTGHKRGSLKKGGKVRVRLRGKWRGFGNMGKYSKKAVSSYKRKTKNTKKLVLIYTCQECKKSNLAKKGKRTAKIQLVEVKK